MTLHLHDNLPMSVCDVILLVNLHLYDNLPMSV